MRRRRQISETDRARVAIALACLCALVLLALHPALHAHVLGVCARPRWLVHTYSERRAHDMPAMILRDLFALDE